MAQVIHKQGLVKRKSFPEPEMLLSERGLNCVLVQKETLNIYVNPHCCFIPKIKVQAELKGLVQKVVNAQRKSLRAALRGFAVLEMETSVSALL